MADSLTSTAVVPNVSLSPTSSANMSTFNNLKVSVKNFLKPAPVSMGVFAAILVLLSVLVFNNKEVYRFTNDNLSNLLGNTMDTEKNCPSQRGVVIHSIVAALVAGLLVYLLHDIATEKLKALLA